ncbi:jg16110 [Pararge aegeria aegeria]|uniref:Jg16110 protein n=1 Tax=Pararge aegeria aegeria TaxID=348720 RepID=A0A8S4RR99_9NEOP|nr:jg16110 [Pararge aegeria aegeria]
MSQEENMHLVEEKQHEVNSEKLNEAGFILKINEEKSVTAEVAVESSLNIINSTYITKTSADKCESVINKSLQLKANGEILALKLVQEDESNDKINIISDIMNSTFEKCILDGESGSVNISDQNVNIENIECKQTDIYADASDDTCRNIYESFVQNENSDVELTKTVSDDENGNNLPVVINSGDFKDLQCVIASEEGSLIHEHSNPINVVDDDSNVSDLSEKGHSDKRKKKKGWRKPKSRTVMPSGGSTGTAREHTHDPSELREEDALHNGKDKDGKKKSKNKEDLASVLIEGVLFRARYLGSTQLACEGQPTKATRMLQAEEAVSRIKAPEGENQPSTEVDLFISTEKIMVLNTELKEIMMDHALRTISYIADIGDLVVLMARRRFVPHETDSDQPKLNRTPKMICHVFESEEAQFIAQSIGQAFQVAYMEFLKANGIEDHSFVKEMDYQEVLNSQEIFGDELQMFAKKELQKEVVVPKTKGEILGVVVVESGWGSMLPTVVIANLAPAGAAARCGQLNIGDQIIAINGVSLVGLPLSTCQTYIKNSKNQTVVKLTVVPCAPVVEVKIKRPDTKYQLGFSVQNGVSTSGRHSGERRSPRGTSHHRDQLAERRGGSARAYRQSTSDLCWRDPNENNAHINVPATDGTGKPRVHITRHKCLLRPTPSHLTATNMPHPTAKLDDLCSPYRLSSAEIKTSDMSILVCSFVFHITHS